MSKYMTINAEGLPTAFFAEDIHGEFGSPECVIPALAVQITDEQWQELQTYEGARKWVGGNIVAIELPIAAVATSVSAVTLWERLTEAEAEQVNAVMATQPFRTRQIFLTANTFRSDHELWPLLVQIATDLFGEERATELLAG